MELDHEFTIPVPVDRAWPMLLDVERVAPCVPGATLDSIDGDELSGRLKVKLGAMTITYRGTARIVKADESARVVTMEGTGKEARGSGTASVTVRAELSPVTGDEAAAESTRVSVHTKLKVTGRPAQFGRNILSEVGGKLVARFAKALSEELTAGTPPAAAGKAAVPAAPEVPAAPAVSASEPPAPEVPAAEAPVSEAPVSEPAGSEAPTPEAPVTEPGTGEAVVSASAKPGPAPEPVRPARAPEAAAAPAGKAADEPAAEGRDAPPVSAVPAGAGAPLERRSEDAIDLLEVAGPSVAKRVAPVAAGVIAVFTVWRVFRRRRGRHHR
ncbi:SRPBCC family protein [Actinomadura sp. HBU206391]|uniref:SRPBCC family protein n=1 Tax=Actinomadura sp. HBU206391 TaxID=2731692 RepID=UPI00164F6923|nr:SRPBCC domain-containing protein [Actinomadura sp. HBU206391]MBC6456965.1 carbon monoxide dehydrogenase [Actinomadura sp. HBU206391]